MPASEASTPGRASLIDLALTLDCPVLDLSLALDCPWPDNPLLHSHTRKCSRHAHAQLWHAHQPSILILHAFLSALLVTVRRTPVRGPLCGVLPHMVHHLLIAKEVVDHPPSSRRTCRCASIPESRRCCCPTLGPARRILVSSGARCTSQPSVRKLVAVWRSQASFLSCRLVCAGLLPDRPAAPPPPSLARSLLSAACSQLSHHYTSPLTHPLTLCML